uniref:Large ribosomal subunit protein uL24 C-terminal domain-containing protein n=1 Tax=Chaetoceros debilis TaxID=122233 RepID=A0A7S3V6A7_9STRA|mmetsp:Transcript_6345/g.9288  ORF Transcript_6345/g.9288 Transcript_6345/m.9288 type:complete len:186 (+) Transcript_6345:91-648(+)|eukprot:CAMPEP_0194099094 /NCGR_PEP_ID=MMETSP0150-20130528/372_1 /TAXON_ID=122233 /ORGANISM="Chaetoceros debilis, Strain MM31A-1" /LENGTH=185 /DNA_ID=CAMNT_0038785253 /DNA_START=91 /DNA_END=648 /DNA_ORIENTATION=+
MATRAKIMNSIMKRTFPKRTEIKPAMKEAAKKTKWNILRGDTVQVIERKHPEFGKQGVVTVVDRRRDRVIIEGVNTGPKRQKANPDRGLAGRTIMKERSIHYSNVNLVDPVSGLPTRVSRKTLEDGSKVRVAKKSGAIIPRPEILKERRRPKSIASTVSDTSDADLVWETTYSSIPESELVRVRE